MYQIPKGVFYIKPIHRNQMVAVFDTEPCIQTRVHIYTHTHTRAYLIMVAKVVDLDMFLKVRVIEIVLHPAHVAPEYVPVILGHFGPA